MARLGRGGGSPSLNHSERRAPVFHKHLAQESDDNPLVPPFLPKDLRVLPPITRCVSRGEKERARHRVGTALGALTDAAWHDRAPPLSAPTPTPKCTLSQTPRGHPSGEVGNLCIIPRWVPNTYTQAHSQVPQNEMHAGAHTLVKSPQALTHSLTDNHTHNRGHPTSQACVHTHTHTHVTLTTCCTVVQGSVIVIFGFSSPHTVLLTCPHPHHQGDTPASPRLPTTRAPARASSSWRWDTESTKCRERNGPGSLFQAAGKWKISA